MVKIHTFKRIFQKIRKKMHAILSDILNFSEIFIHFFRIFRKIQKKLCFVTAYLEESENSISSTYFENSSRLYKFISNEDPRHKWYDC